MSQDPRGKAIEPGSLPIEDPCQHGRDHTGEAAAEDIGQIVGADKNTLLLLARDRSQFAKSTPEMKAWFDALKSERGPCCSDADGTVVSDVDWDTKDGHYRVRLDGEWIRCAR
jgi:hypothetical protein